MAAVLVVAVCALVVLGVALSSFLLWVSCKICRVARPATPGGKPRGVSYLRALLCAVGLAVVGNLAGLAFYYAFSALAPGGGGLPATPLLVTACLVEFAAVLTVHVLFLRFTLPASIGKSALVVLLWNVFSVVSAVGLFFAIRAGVAEAYVMPTGTMADTLYGYHKEVVCPQCGYEFAVNCSQEVDPQNPQRDSSGRIVNADHIGACTCPNCREHIRFVPPGTNKAPDEVEDPPANSGDRILVGRGLFGAGVVPPQRFDLVVFEYPHDAARREPSPPMNYIKRLIGLPGETIAIHNGDLYSLPPDKGPQYDDLRNAAKPDMIWQKQYKPQLLINVQVVWD